MKFDARLHCVLECKLMRLTEPRALAYLEEQGFKMGKRTYYTCLRKIHERKGDSMRYIAQNWDALHIERIEKLRKIEQELWEERTAKKQIIKTTVSITEGVDQNDKPFKIHKETPEITHIEQTPIERTRIRQAIAEMQLYLSAYEEATRDIMEETLAQMRRNNTNGIKQDSKDTVPESACAAQITGI